MEVSQGQLYGLLPSILEVVRSSRFVALDMEMTGISFGDVGASSLPVSPQDAYSQAKRHSWSNNDDKKMPRLFEPSDVIDCMAEDLSYDILVKDDDNMIKHVGGSR
ncbi:hypothetical protein DL769_002669 [Monosporascus sp. CRB-8-3]|nr:hypothetical protein DL769_002669 [Monosporascus sp. CRB-8-3]